MQRACDLRVRPLAIQTRNGCKARTTSRSASSRSWPRHVSTNAQMSCDPLFPLASKAAEADLAVLPVYDRWVGPYEDCLRCILYRQSLMKVPAIEACRVDFVR